MQELFRDQTIGSVGKPAFARSAVASFLCHAIVILFVMSVPYWAAETMPERLTRAMFLAPPPPPPPAAPAVLVKAARTRVNRVVRAFSPALTAPATIPEHAVAVPAVLEIPAETEIIPGAPGGVPGGVPGGIQGGVLGGILPGVQPPARPPVREAKKAEPPEAQPPARIQVDSEVQAGKLLVLIQPDYPSLAMEARLQGDVHVTAIIDRNGKITEFKILDGNPLFVAAVQRALQKWRYRPTFLHGEPVEVVTEITVTFRLRT